MQRALNIWRQGAVAQHLGQIPPARVEQRHIVVCRGIMVILRRVCQRAHRAPQPDSVMQPASQATTAQ